MRTKAPLDYETKKTHNVEVSVRDGEMTSEDITITVDVTDVNEPPEVTGLDSVDYAENGTDPVDTYTATDPDENAR